MNKVTQFLKQDTFQRISYILLLICWIVIFLDSDIRNYITSYVDYLPLIFIIPVILLVLQILFNNRILWTIIWACIVLYTAWTIFKMVTFIGIDQHRAYSHAIEWNAATISRFVFIAMAFIAVNWFFFKLKPIKK